MFIREVTLENFQNLKTGIGVRKLHIDFRKQKNPVCIITGPNGAGKTSLLSYLTPFATVGDLDIRNATKPIIPHKDGYKNIVFVDDEMNEYEIEHFYTPKSDGSFAVKSYFKMNDMEMNPNGNVRSFLDLVSEYLDIEIGYLKLIRIGDNVKNLISAKSTERKQFSAKLLEDVDWYLTKYKLASQKERDIKTICSHIINEITKTGITDPDGAKAEIKGLKDQLQAAESHLSVVEADKATIEYELSKLAGKDQLEMQYRAAEHQIKRFKTALMKAKDQHIEDVATANKVIVDYEKKSSKLEATIEAVTKDVETTLRDIDTEHNELDSVKSEIKKEEESTNLTSMEEYYKTLIQKKVSTYSASYDSYSFAFTKDEYEEFMVFLKNMQNLLNITYEYGKEPIRRVLQAMLKNEDIPAIITSSLITIEAQENAERLSLIDRIINRYASIKIDCKEDCALKQLHAELMDIKDAVPVSDVKYTSEFYQMMKLAYENLSNIFTQISDRKEFIMKLPEEIKAFFITDTMYKKIGDCECIYDDKVLNDYLSLLTEIENYKKVEKECDEVAAEIKRLKSVSRIDFLTAQEKKINEKLDKLGQKLYDKQAEKGDLEIKLSKVNADLSMMRVIEEALTSYEEAQKTMTEVQESKDAYTKLSLKLADVQKAVFQWKSAKDELSSQVFKMSTNLEKYTEYMKSLNTNRLLQEEYKNLKFALSGKTGIPLEHIRLYFKEVTKIANQLLDIVFDGHIYLDKFIITETDFLMPYVKDGHTIEDVSCASQGETSFFNMAISSALRAVSMTKYNIGLYDEVDSQFDDKNRQKFIPSLEKQLELNKIKQAFVITHNLMFRQYPVDIINMENLEESTVDVTYEL